MCELSSIPKDSLLYSRVRDYSRLATLPTLSDSETERVAEIYDEAQYDVNLSNFIDRIDEVIHEEEINNKLKQEKLLRTFTLEEFICKTREILPESMNLDLFASLVEQLDLSSEIINFHIFPNVNKGKHYREIIHNSKFLTISAIAWGSGAHIPKHSHKNSLSIIRVCKGELTHWRWQPLGSTKA
jgi:hypothetical protein